MCVGKCCDLKLHTCTLDSRRDGMKTESLVLLEELAMTVSQTMNPSVITMLC